jgi:hypothetical protein
VELGSVDHTEEATTVHWVLEITLDDGEEIHAQAGDDREAALAQLTSLHERLGDSTFVQIGPTAVVRSNDVRYVQVCEHEHDGDGILDSIKTRLGGRNMETQERDRTAAMPHAGGEERWASRREPGYRGSWAPSWSETTPFLLTSEFLMAIGLIAAIAIASAVSDLLNADRAWLLITVVGAAYIVSRGIARAGTRAPDRAGELGDRR